MKIDLLKIHEEIIKDDERLNQITEEIKFKNELKYVIAAIIKGHKEYSTTNKNFIDTLGINTKLSIASGWNGKNSIHTIILNKTNINKIQKYIDKEGI